MLVTKPVVAVDVDDVLTPFAQNLLVYHNQIFNETHTIEDYSVQPWSKAWGIPHAEAQQRLARFHKSTHFKNMQPIPEAQRILRLLMPKYNFVAVTARAKPLEAHTKSWLERHFQGIFKDLRLTDFWDDPAQSTSKGDICIEVGAKVMIEDSLPHAHSCAKCSVPVLLLDTPWNQVRRLPKLVKRVKGWPEIERHLLVAPY